VDDPDVSALDRLNDLPGAPIHLAGGERLG